MKYGISETLLEVGYGEQAAPTSPVLSISGEAFLAVSTSNTDYTVWIGAVEVDGLVDKLVCSSNLYLIRNRTS